MRAKRSQEVKHLETIVYKLQGKNQRLEERLLPTGCASLAHTLTLLAAVKPSLLLLFYDRCRESARRMRAKRGQEVKHLETTVTKLQDKNQRLEEQNREYAKSLQQLQDEMRSLRTQLQGNMSQQQQQQQQQSSSEVHQVCSYTQP